VIEFSHQGRHYVGLTPAEFDEVRATMQGIIDYPAPASCELEWADLTLDAGEAYDAFLAEGQEGGDFPVGAVPLIDTVEWGVPVDVYEELLDLFSHARVVRGRCASSGGGGDDISPLDEPAVAGPTVQSLGGLGLLAGAGLVITGAAILRGR